MKFFRICRPALSVAALLCALASAEEASLFTSPLPTGVRLDPAGEAVDLGSLPINLVLAPEKERAVVVLSGWREQGVQVVDLKMRKVTQTLLQDGAFYGAAFSPDGHHLGVSGFAEKTVVSARSAVRVDPKLPPEIALQPGAPAYRAGDHELMSTVFVGEAHPPQGDPDNMFTVKNPVPGEKAAGSVEETGCKIQWPA